MPNSRFSPTLPRSDSGRFSRSTDRPTGATSGKRSCISKRGTFCKRGADILLQLSVDGSGQHFELSRPLTLELRRKLLLEQTFRTCSVRLEAKPLPWESIQQVHRAPNLRSWQNLPCETTHRGVVHCTAAWNAYRDSRLPCSSERELIHVRSRILMYPTPFITVIKIRHFLSLHCPSSSRLVAILETDSPLSAENVAPT